MGLPLGDCAARDPRLEVLSRRLRWVVSVANSLGIVGTLHRHLATSGVSGTWNEPTLASSSALSSIGWTLEWTCHGETLS